jgi:predicted ester cyclase
MIMSRPAQLAVTRRVIQAINERDWATLATLMPVERAMEFQSSQFLAAFPDIQTTIDELFADGDRVIARWTNRGTHLGPFLGIAATGKSIAYMGISIDQIADGQIVDSWIVSDMWDLLQQLGVTIQPVGRGSAVNSP